MNSSATTVRVPASNNSVKCKRVHSRRKLIIAFFTATVVTITCGVLALFWPAIINAILAYQLPLRPGSDTFEIWREIPLPFIMKFYFFNCTNSVEVQKFGAVPHFVELGPYAYKMYRKKVDIAWTDDATVKYHQNNTWHFQPHLSNGSLQDQIVSLHPIPLTAATMAIDQPGQKMAVKFVLDMFDMEAFGAHTVEELTFGGYEDPLVSMMHTFNIQLTPIELDKFSWFYRRNGSSIYDGYFNMHTGQGDISQICQVVEWKHSNRTPAYPAECGEITGTTGELFPPNYPRTSVKIFNADMCRAMSFPYAEDIVYKGISAYRFHGTAALMKNSTEEPSNWCYEGKGPKRSGVSDVGGCKFNAPAFLSYPHFLHADPWYLSSVDGISPPSLEEHETSLIIEPSMGLPLAAKVKFQLNLLLQPIQGFRIYENVPYVFFPCLWFDLSGGVDDEMAGQMSLAITAIYAAEVMFYVLATIGAVAQLLVVFILIKEACR